MNKVRKFTRMVISFDSRSETKSGKVLFAEYSIPFLTEK